MRVMAFVILPLAMTLNGCATMAHGTTQSIPITSSPQGARVLVDSESIGVTPLVASLSRKQSHVVTVVHDSFPPARVVVDRNVSPWILASFFFYVVPAIVDFSNGAAYGFPSDTLRVVLSGSTEMHSARIPGGSVATAAVASTFIGFGSGQRVLGARAWPFFVTDIAAGTAATVGLGLGLAGENGGEELFFGGLVVLTGSRIWQVVDLIRFISDRNAPAGSAASASTTHYRSVSLVPILDTRSKGVALRLGF